MVEKVKFSKKFIAEVQACKKSSGYDTYHDAEERNLVLLVTTTGAKTYYVLKKVDGKVHRIKIGRVDEIISPTIARREAVKIKASLAQGVNPNNDKKKLSNTMTFGGLANYYLEEYISRHKKSYDEVKRYIDTHTKKIANRPLKEIGRDIVRKLHSNITETHSPYVANKAIAYIKSVFNWGISEKDIDIINPAQRIKLNQEKERDRFLSQQECSYFFKAINAIGDSNFSDFLLLAIYTGVRRRNILSLKWENVSLSDNLFYLPDTKNNESQYVALINEAKDILKTRYNNRTSSIWVFPSDKSSSGHLEEPKTAWKRIKQLATIYIWKEDIALRPIIDECLKTTNNDYIGAIYNKIISKADEANIVLPKGIMDVRIHDLRRTLGSYLSMSGANEYVIGKSLNHKSQAATKRYARSNVEQIRNSMQSALELMGVNDG